MLHARQAQRRPKQAPSIAKQSQVSRWQRLALEAKLGPGLGAARFQRNKEELMVNPALEDASIQASYWVLRVHTRISNKFANKEQTANT